MLIRLVRRALGRSWLNFLGLISTSEFDYTSKFTRKNVRSGLAEKQAHRVSFWVRIGPFSAGSNQVDSQSLARVAEWQTRWIQNPVPARVCGFDPHLWYLVLYCKSCVQNETETTHGKVSESIGFSGIQK